MHQISWKGGLWIPNLNRASDLGLWRADSIVEVFEAKGTVPFHWNDHYQRMLAACEGHIPMELLPDETALMGALVSLLRKGGCTYSIVHMQITPGGSVDLKIPDGMPVLTLDIRPHQIQDVPPLALKTIPEHRLFPLFKLGASYGNVPRFMHRYSVKEGGFDSFIYRSENSGLLEGPFENLFFVTKDGNLVTASEGVLHGVTRQIILDLARKSGLFGKVSEWPGVHSLILESAQEAFLTSTTKGTAPIRQIDAAHFKTGDGTFTSELRKLFLEYRDSYYKERGA